MLGLSNIKAKFLNYDAKNSDNWCIIDKTENGNRRMSEKSIHAEVLFLKDQHMSTHLKHCVATRHYRYVPFKRTNRDTLLALRSNPVQSTSVYN